MSRHHEHRDVCRPLHRRAFLKGGAVAVFGMGLSGGGPLFLRRAAWAASDSRANRRRPVLVTVFQRGAMDGLMAVPPLAPELRGPLDRLRPSLRMSAARSAGDERLLDLGVGFGLHPAFASFEPLWRDGQLGIVHAVGSPDPTRSHFDAQDYMETGTPGRKSTRSGWLDRVVGELGHETRSRAPSQSGEPSALRAVALTESLPRSLQGNSGAVAIASLDEFRLEDGGDSPSRTSSRRRRNRRSPARRSAPRERSEISEGSETSESSELSRRGFERLYGDAAPEGLRSAGAETFEAIDAVSKLDGKSYVPRAGAAYPDSPLGASLRQVAQLIKADVGLEIAFAESGGWDTHVRQGTTRGSFARHSRDLADAIAAFWTDLGRERTRVVLLTMTEFGRTVAENGSSGTDHGRASCMFVLGEHVDGGAVHGQWPGLEREQLFEGRDLEVVTDFRSVFGELAASHLGVKDLGAVFPGWSGNRLPLVRS